MLIAVSQYLFKVGSKYFNIKKPFSFLLNAKILLGLGLYILYFILLITAYRFAESSIIFPMLSLCYIWAFILARVYLKEEITFIKMLGILFIIFGSITIGFK